ncbi:uncharacterized protein [Henckelia pumila]|uniref:uncharacterized protein n=1 Tax=Henckelia pumila TaxID=405737 RepID=UPI003C6DD5A3
MFFFFVGSLEQQPTKLLESGAGKCIACGSRADLMEYEKVLKLFFVPVWRWPGNHPLLRCDNCNLFFPQSLSPTDAIRSQSVPGRWIPPSDTGPFVGPQ